MEFDWQLMEHNCPDMYSVIVASRLSVSPDFHIKCAMNFPMILSVEPTYVSQKSFGLQYQCVDKVTSNVLMQQKMDLVLMDPTTRKSTEVPEQYLQRLKMHASPQKPERIVIPDKPENCFTYKTYIVMSDFDCYNHVNQSVYIRLTTDAANEAFEKNYFSSLGGKFDDYDIKQIDALYLKEITETKEVKVHLWKGDVASSFYCQIDNPAGEISYRSLNTLYRDLPDNLVTASL